MTTDVWLQLLFCIASSELRRKWEYVAFYEVKEILETLDHFEKFGLFITDRKT